MSRTEKRYLGPYQLKRVIGQGGMGTVYEALDPRLNRKVAIKTLRPDIFDDDDAGFHGRFVREARAAAALSHPNIVTIFDVGDEDDKVYIVMELIPGPNLKQRLEESPPPVLREVLDAAISVCEGLHHAHEKGLVHRDIKPANVLLGPEHTKIADFGIALRSDATVTRTSGLVGTPQYMSPEQYDTSQVDRRSDIFSTGVILYEALTGQLPFDGDTPAAVMRNILMAVPRPPSEIRSVVSAALSEAVMRALEKDPAARYQTAKEFAGALQHAAGEMSGRVLDKTQVRVSAMPTARMKATPFEQGQPPAGGTPVEMHSPLTVTSTEPEHSADVSFTPLIILVVALLGVVSIVFALLMVWPSS